MGGLYQSEVACNASPGPPVADILRTFSGGYLTPHQKNVWSHVGHMQVPAFGALYATGLDAPNPDDVAGWLWFVFPLLVKARRARGVPRDEA